jgi:hypothetical protein
MEYLICHSLAAQQLLESKNFDNATVRCAHLDYVNENNLTTYAPDEHTIPILPPQLNPLSTKSYANMYINNMFELKHNIRKRQYDKLDTFTIYPHPAAQIDFYKELIGITLTIDREDVEELCTYGVSHYINGLVCFSFSIIQITDDSNLDTTKNIPYSTLSVEGEIEPVDIYQTILTDLTFAKYIPNMK